jgi:hypothetical protein
VEGILSDNAACPARRREDLIEADTGRDGLACLGRLVGNDQSSSCMRPFGRRQEGQLTEAEDRAFVRCAGQPVTAGWDDAVRRLIPPSPGAYLVAYDL